MALRPVPLHILAVWVVVAFVVSARAPITVSYDLDNVGRLPHGNHSLPAEHGITFHVEVTKQSLRFGVGSEDGIGPFRLTLFLDDAKFREMKSGPVAVLAEHVRLREEVSRSLIADSGDDATLRLELQEVEVAKITFSYVLENPLTVAPNLYDARVTRSMFGTYYMFNITDDSISWFVKRRPPIPGFLAMVKDSEGHVLSRAPVNSVPPDGIGFVNIIDKKKISDPSQMPSLTLSTTFFEFPRDIKVSTSVNVKDVLRRLEQGEPHVDIATGSDVVPWFRLSRPQPGADALTVVLLQQAPIENLLLRALRSRAGNSSAASSADDTVSDDDSDDDSDDGETGDRASEGVAGIQLFAEVESNVPFVDAAASDATHFGWVGAVPLKPFDKDNINNATLVLIAYFDRRELPPGTKEEVVRAHDVFRFIRDHGGAVSGSVAATTKPKAQLVLTATRGLRRGEEIASIPFRLLLQHQVCDAVPAIKRLLASEEWREHAAGKPPILSNVVSLALCMVMKPNSPFDGTNWRTVFDSFYPTTPLLPMFWDEQELDALLKWSAAHTEVRLQKETWREEFDIVESIIGGNLTRHLQFDEYRAARGHMLSSLINVSGSLVLPPLLHLLRHDDDPNVGGFLDQEKRQYVLFALRDIAEGSVLSADRGAKDKFKGEFFIHFGTIPPGAIDSGTVGNFGLPLTLDKRSRSPILAKIRAQHAELHDGASMSDSAALTEMETALQVQLHALPQKIPETASQDANKVKLAQRLIEAERAVLNAHLAYIRDDKDEL